MTESKTRPEENKTKKRKIDTLCKPKDILYPLEIKKVKEINYEQTTPELEFIDSEIENAIDKFSIYLKNLIKEKRDIKDKNRKKENYCSYIS